MPGLLKLCRGQSRLQNLTSKNHRSRQAMPTSLTHVAMRQQARQHTRVHRLLATRYVGVGLGNNPGVVAGRKNEWHMAPAEFVGDWPRALLTEINVENGAIERAFSGDQLQRLSDGPRWAHDF